MEVGGEVGGRDDGKMEEHAWNAFHLSPEHGILFGATGIPIQLALTTSILYGAGAWLAPLLLRRREAN